MPIWLSVIAAIGVIVFFASAMFFFITFFVMAGIENLKSCKDAWRKLKGVK